MNEQELNRIIEKSKQKIAITKLKKESQNMSKKSVLKKIAMITVVFGITFTGAYAGYIFVSEKHENVWKEPTKYGSYNEMINSLPPSEVSEEEKQEQKLITEEEAKKKALEILEILGYENQEINRIELKRGYSGEDDTESYYMVKTKYGYEEGLMVLLDSKTGEFQDFEDMELKYKHINSDEISDEKAKEIAYDIYHKLGFKDGEYELVDYNTRQENYFQNESNIICGFNFYKTYNGVINNFEKVSGSYIIKDNQIFLNTISVQNTNRYENNPIEVTKESAERIALEKEKQISGKEDLKIEDSKLSICMMNTTIYQLENKQKVVNNPMENESSDTQSEYLEVERLIRNVWKVKIIHTEKNIFDINAEVEEGDDVFNKYVREEVGKTYFVDCTTGEIIGGELGELKLY